MHEIGEKFTQGFRRKIRKTETSWGRVKRRVNAGMNLKAIQLGLHSCRYFCEQGNKPTFYITTGEFLCKRKSLGFSKTNRLHGVRINLSYPFVLRVHK
jgi:uncharacterized cupin superfamily protein